MQTTFKEYLMEANEFKSLQKYKKPLTPDERDECMQGKATWHHGPKGEASPAVWKSVNKDGKTTYITNTHRAFNTAKTMKSAIKKYHDFIKGTA